jgi:hypothetical protein
MSYTYTRSLVDQIREEQLAEVEEFFAEIRKELNDEDTK